MIKSLLADRTGNYSERATSAAVQLLGQLKPDTFHLYADVLVDLCAHLFEFGQSTLAISYGKELLSVAKDFEDLPVQRRMSNILGAQYCDTADFAIAMDYLETAVSLARILGDPTIEAACLANVIVVLQEMGHYRQAILMAERVLGLQDNSYIANSLKLQCSSNGLFAAQRMGNAAAAAMFLAEGQKYLSMNLGPLRRVFFEKARVTYLVECGKAELAHHYLEETLKSINQEDETPRLRILLAVSTAVCNWGIGNKTKARSSLELLHEESRVSRLYHHFVLQGLVIIYGDSESPSDALRGLNFARELVEFTTSVKKAKFYRQLASKREESEHRASALSTTLIDPFGAVKDWLIASDVNGPVSETSSNRRLLAKHEELTAIHEDMARLRVASLRREIRTDAVDTAENWAIAAEFFDDETGQHCYRVGHLASMLAREIGMPDTFCVQVEHAARLHDIGKIAVNEVILLKPGPLDASEMAAMRLHTEVGAQILSGSDDPTLKMAVDVARHHHEWWNGAGYPAKISGKSIPLSARVSAYADVYDALTHARAYKKAWSHERALEEIERLTGTQFDPELIVPFRAVLHRYVSDLEAKAIPAFTDMNSNALIASRRKLMETIGGESQ